MLNAIFYHRVDAIAIDDMVEGVVFLGAMICDGGAWLVIGADTGSAGCAFFLLFWKMVCDQKFHQFSKGFALVLVLAFV